ncbi:hypothetical protein HYPSUDRAFT_72809 [Hypholoma sublateritium FD-334 SS-4]|uniref:F-box domain-containing protein n=1 Tax=Hypholoma sublateritium (strain FD-334 SS-4) TaxID=945553 RepID=A0A0D2N3W0_HYPSF|nr:hypothetical protein HYPSUDRAFT_72809 [Hypholoma sublateritium FD-334 SS-4]
MTAPLLETGSVHRSFKNLFGTNTIPSHEQTNMLLSGLAEPEKTLRATNDEATRLQLRLSVLSAEKQHLTKIISPYKALISPFRRLPNDVLREVFLACLPTEHNPHLDVRQASLLLTFISNHTRQVALSTPRLWAAIHIPLISQESTSNKHRAVNRVMSKRENAVEEWILCRSGACDIPVPLYEAWTERPSAESYKKIFETIASAAPRLRRLSLTLLVKSFRHFCDVLGRSTLPRLKFLTFKLVHNFDDIGSSIMAFNASSLVTATNLRNLCLSTGAANYSVYNMNWAHITDISLGKNGAVSMTSVDSVLRLCSQLRSCALCIDLDGAVPRASLLHLTALSLSFYPGAWWGLSTEYAINIFAEVDVPALESVTYEDFVGPLPLLGILQRADERIIHLSVTNLGKPVNLIRCLKLCPRLIALELEVRRPKRLPSTGVPAIDADLEEWRAWSDYLTQWPTAGGPIFDCFTMGDNTDTPVPEKLCPKLERLSYRLAHGPVSCATVERFIRGKCGLAAIQTNRYGVLRELVAHVDGGETEIRQVRESVAEALLAGLSLTLIPPLPLTVKPARFPTDIGLHPKPRMEVLDDDGDDNDNNGDA